MDLQEEFSRQHLCKHSNYATVQNAAFFSVSTADVTWQEWGGVTWPLRSAVTSHTCNVWRQQEWRKLCFSARSDQRGYPEVNSDVKQFTLVQVSSRLRVRVISQVKWSSEFVVEEESSLPCEDLKCDWKTFFVCNIWSDLKRKFLCLIALPGED
jgi:hypothetical protein